VLASSFAAFFWICDTGFRRSIETTVNAASQSNLQTIERLILSAGPGDKPGVARELRDLAGLWANGAVFEVADEDGRWLFRSEPFLAESPELRGALDAEVEFLTTNLSANQYRVAVARPQLGGAAFEIHAAVPTEPFDQALDRFRLIE